MPFLHKLCFIFHFCQIICARANKWKKLGKLVKCSSIYDSHIAPYHNHWSSVALVVLISILCVMKKKICKRPIRFTLSVTCHITFQLCFAHPSDTSIRTFFSVGRSLSNTINIQPVSFYDGHLKSEVYTHGKCVWVYINMLYDWWRLAIEWRRYHK